MRVVGWASGGDCPHFTEWARAEPMPGATVLGVGRVIEVVNTYFVDPCRLAAHSGIGVDS